MIVVNRYKEGLSIRGHAGYAQHGQDIVCAAVSTLTQALIRSIEGLTADTIQYDIKPGAVDIKHGNLSANAQLLIDSFFVGVQMVADSYPAYVRVDLIVERNKGKQKNAHRELTKH